MMIAAIVMFAAAAHTSARSLPDACHVLTKSEIAAVQGEAFLCRLVATFGSGSAMFRLPHPPC